LGARIKLLRAMTRWIAEDGNLGKVGSGCLVCFCFRFQPDNIAGGTPGNRRDTECQSCITRSIMSRVPIISRKITNQGHTENAAPPPSARGFETRRHNNSKKPSIPAPTLLPANFLSLFAFLSDDRVQVQNKSSNNHVSIPHLVN
jgi:hypothetical protein